MLKFSYIKKLNKHHEYISAKFQNKNLFFVWWCIRDLVLWISKDLVDIDIACAWKPDKIYKKLDTKSVSHFNTEKYWTITVIPKKWEKTHGTQYELTPFRAESDYTDNRHPDEISWSDDLIKDASRRDFSVNSLYYTFVKQENHIEINSDVEFIQNHDSQDIYEFLNKHWIIYLSKEKLLIIQEKNKISKILPKWELKQTELKTLLLNLETIFWPKIKSFPNKIWVILDPNSWVQDIVNPKIKAIWEKNKRFQEDALRIIRALRFVCVFNKQLKNKANRKSKINLFDIEKETWLAMKENINLVQNIANERIKDETTKAFQKGSAFAYISLLDEIKLLEYIFPSVYKTKYDEQPVRYHPFDTYAHTLLTLYELEKINDNYLVKLAMVYHDVWKPAQYWAYSTNPNPDEIRKILWWELNHRVSWPKIANKELWKLTFSKKELTEISRYIAEHHTPWEILDAKPQNREKKLRKLYSRAWFTQVNNLIDITIADRKWQYNPMQNSADITDVEDLRTMLQELKEKEWQFTMKDLAISWNDLIEELKIAPWPKLWELLQRAFNRVLNDIKNRNNKPEIVKYIKTL